MSATERLREHDFDDVRNMIDEGHQILAVLWKDADGDEALVIEGVQRLMRGAEQHLSNLVRELLAAGAVLANGESSTAEAQPVVAHKTTRKRKAEVRK